MCHLQTQKINAFHWPGINTLKTHDKITSVAYLLIKQLWLGSFENEALENEDRSTKHSNLENEAPKTRNHCSLKNYNFKSCMTQAEPGGGNECVRTSKGPQIHPTVLF